MTNPFDKPFWANNSPYLKPDYEFGDNEIGNINIKYGNDNNLPWGNDDQYSYGFQMEGAVKKCQSNISLHGKVSYGGITSGHMGWHKNESIQRHIENDPNGNLPIASEQSSFNFMDHLDISLGFTKNQELKYNSFEGLLEYGVTIGVDVFGKVGNAHVDIQKPWHEQNNFILHWEYGNHAKETKYNPYVRGQIGAHLNKGSFSKTLHSSAELGPMKQNIRMGYSVNKNSKHFYFNAGIEVGYQNLGPALAAGGYDKGVHARGNIDIGFKYRGLHLGYHFNGNISNSVQNNSWINEVEVPGPKPNGNGVGSAKTIVGAKNFRQYGEIKIGLDLK